MDWAGLFHSSSVSPILQSKELRVRNIIFGLDSIDSLQHLPHGIRLSFSGYVFYFADFLLLSVSVSSSKAKLHLPWGFCNGERVCAVI